MVAYKAVLKNSQETALIKIHSDTLRYVIHRLDAKVSFAVLNKQNAVY